VIRLLCPALPPDVAMDSIQCITKSYERVALELLAADHRELPEVFSGTVGLLRGDHWARHHKRKIVYIPKRNG
jgi:hypothetical protein